MFLSIEEVIADLQVDMGFSTPKYNSILKRWCYEAVRDIGVGYMEVKTKTYFDIGTVINKPDDYVSAAHVYFVTDSGQCVEPFKSNLKCCSDTPFNFRKWGYVQSDLSSSSWTIAETSTSFQISSDAANNFSKMVLVYYAVPIDSDGDPKVPEFAKWACTAFCQYKHLVRERNSFRTGSKDSRGNPVPQSEIAYWKNEFTNEIDKARGEMNSPSYRELREVGEAIMFGVGNSFPQLLGYYQELYTNNTTTTN